NLLSSSNFKFWHTRPASAFAAQHMRNTISKSRVASHTWRIMKEANMSTYDPDPNRRYELDRDTGAGNWAAGIIGVLVIVGLICWGVWGAWGPGGGNTQTADNTPVTHPV